MPHGHGRWRKRGKWHSESTGRGQARGQEERGKTRQGGGTGAWMDTQSHLQRREGGGQCPDTEGTEEHSPAHTPPGAAKIQRAHVSVCPQPPGAPGDWHLGVGTSFRDRPPAQEFDPGGRELLPFPCPLGDGTRPGSSLTGPSRVARPCPLGPPAWRHWGSPRAAPHGLVTTKTADGPAPAAPGPPRPVQEGDWACTYTRAARRPRAGQGRPWGSTSPCGLRSRECQAAPHEGEGSVLWVLSGRPIGRASGSGDNARRGARRGRFLCAPSSAARLGGDRVGHPIMGFRKLSLNVGVGGRGASFTPRGTSQSSACLLDSFQVGNPGRQRVSGGRLLSGQSGVQTRGRH